MNDYVELYKKSRPKTWDEIIGQDRIVKSLRSAVEKNSIPTAYLFSGPRGCGKTTAALIMAKAINCENPQPGGNPCNECDTCRNIDSGSQIGVNYVSMANFGSVDSVKEIMKSARLSQPLKKQVWILDEVHNLKNKQGAFDAMLIPLEDENMPSLFILCTTEAQKVPATIMSRVQQRVFRTVESSVMTKYVKELVQKYDIKDVTDKEIREAVKNGNGSVRDTLSDFDAIMVTGGSSETSYGDQLLDSISEASLEKTLQVVKHAVSEGFENYDLAEQLFRDLEMMYLISSGVRDKDLLGPQYHGEDSIKIAKNLMGMEGCFKLLIILEESINAMESGSDPNMRLEMACVKMIYILKSIRKKRSQV